MIALITLAAGAYVFICALVYACCVVAGRVDREER